MKCDICGETRLRIHEVTINSILIKDNDRKNKLCCECTAKLEMWFEGKNIPYGLHGKNKVQDGKIKKCR